MTATLALITVVCLHLTLPTELYSQNWQRLPGKVGSARNSNSGWLDLLPKRDFKRGEKIRLTIGGSAARIVVRLLPEGSDPNDEVGILGDYQVRQNRVVEIQLNDDHKAVVQISVHGGPNPWNNWSLGGGNGPATLRIVERMAQ